MKAAARDKPESAFDSIRFNKLSDSNVISTSGPHPEKHSEQRIGLSFLSPLLPELTGVLDNFRMLIRTGQQLDSCCFWSSPPQ
jgi:hypothetical protein